MANATRIIKTAENCSRSGAVRVFELGQMNPDTENLGGGFACEIEANPETTYVTFIAPGQDECAFSMGQPIHVLLAVEAGRAALHTNGDDCWGDFITTVDGIEITLDDTDDNGEPIVINL